MESNSPRDQGSCSKLNKNKNRHQNLKIRVNAVKCSSNTSNMDQPLTCMDQLAPISDTSDENAVLSAKTEVMDDKTGTQSVVSAVIMTRRRRQSIQCPINPSNLKALSNVSRRSRSLSTTCSTTSIHSSFIQCSASELRATPCRRSARTPQDPLAHETVKNAKYASSKSPGTKDLKLKIKLGFNHSMQRNVRNLKPLELLDIEDDSTYFERPKPCVRNLNASIKNKINTKNMKKQKVEKNIESESVDKTLIISNSNIQDKSTTISTGSQTDNDLTILWPNPNETPKNINTNEKFIEFRHELHFQKQNQLKSSNTTSSLNELNDLLSFLTPNQLNWLICVQKLQRKEDLLYLNLWQLHKMGIYEPEIIKALMNIAIQVGATEWQNSFSDEHCLNNNNIHVSDDDNESVNLVIDEEPKMQAYENVHNGLASIVRSEANEKVQALKKQNDLGNAFTDLLTEATDIADKVLEKLLKVKNQNLEPNDKFQILWPLYELLKQQEKRIEILWETLLKISGRCKSAVNAIIPSTEEKSSFGKKSCLPKIEGNDSEENNNLLTDNEMCNGTQYLKSDSGLEVIDNDKLNPSDSVQNLIKVLPNSSDMLIAPLEPSIEQINTVSSSKSDEEANKSKDELKNKNISQNEPYTNIDADGSQNLNSEVKQKDDLLLNADTDSRNEDKLVKSNTDFEKEYNNQNSEEKSTECNTPKTSKALERNTDLLNTPDSTEDNMRNRDEVSKAQLISIKNKDLETELEQDSYLDCTVDDEFLNYVSCNTDSIVRDPQSNEKQKPLQRKSPRLRSEGSEDSSIVQKKYKPRRLRIPKTEIKSVNVDPRRKSKSTVYSTPKKAMKDESDTFEESSAQTVSENKSFILKKVHSKSSLDSSDSEVTFMVTLPSLSLQDFENEDVELGMQALHSDESRVTDNSSNCSQTEEVTSKSDCHDNLLDHANNSKPINVTPVRIDPRRQVSYENIDTFLSPSASQAEENDSSSVHPAQNVANLKRRSLESYEDSNCSNSKITKLKNDEEDDSSVYYKERTDTLTANFPKRNERKSVNSSFDYSSDNEILPLVPYKVSSPGKDQLSSVKVQNVYSDIEEQIKTKSKETHSPTVNVANESIRESEYNKTSYYNENISVNLPPIASPSPEGDSISSPSPLYTDGSFFGDEEIDGRMTYPPIPYILYEVDISRNFQSKPLDINKLIKSNSQDPRIFRNHSKKTSLYSTRQQTLGPSGSYPHDPRNRIIQREVQVPIIPSSPQPSVHNAVVSYNVNTRSEASSVVAMRSSSSLMHSNVMPHSTSNNGLTYPYTQTENPVKVLLKHLHLSPWYQSLMMSTKMQINQTVSHLVRALNNFQRERQLNPEAVFDIFKIDFAGEILEVFSNLGLAVDANGMIVEESQMMRYRTQQNSNPMQNHGLGGGVVPPLNATYSFFQQVLTPPAQCAGLTAATRQSYNAATGSLNEPFFSCYIEAPKPLSVGTTHIPSCIPKSMGCCGSSFSGGAANTCGPTCSESKRCGCGINTTCMNHQQHNFEGHQHNGEQQQYHSHSKHNCMSQSFEPNTNATDYSNDDRHHNKFRKSYQNNSDTSQRPINNQRYSNGPRFSNSPSRSGSPPASSSTSPRGNGRGGGRGRGGGFGRFNKRSNRSSGGSGGNSRQTSSWESSSPPNETFANDGKFNKNKYDKERDYPSYKNITSSAPKERSPSPLKSPKDSYRAGSPLLNSPARQQQQSLAENNNDDEENWD